jgi:outer membrane protein TolC
LLDIENQAITVASARNQLLPNLDVNAGWTQSGLDSSTNSSADSLGTGRFYDWVVGLQFEVQIPYRGRVSNYRNTRDALQQFELQKHDLENSIVIEVDQAIRQLEFAYRAVQNLADEVRLQEALLRAERSKLRAGTSDAYTVSQIENDLIDVRSRELRAKTDFENYRAAYEKAVGTLLDRHGVTLD